jgi:predicted membrane channel-forming protein YqfA (hemolysin III family)
MQMIHSAPAGAVSLGLVVLALPSNFPHPPRTDRWAKELINLKSFRRVDFLGTFLLLAASILFVAAVQQGGIEYSWKSSVILSLLIVSLILGPCFFLWERWQDTRKTEQEPVFPWRLTTNRFAMGTLL